MPYPNGFELFGVNLSGAEFASSVRGTLGRDYVYPDASDLDYYASKGMNAVRIPFVWERIQPTASGPLDASELAALDATVAGATARGLTTILDVHNYGYYHGGLVGEAVPNAAFADLWSKLAAHFKGNANVVFGLMNEPHDQTPEAWLGSVNAAIDAIRATGATQTVLIDGTGWSGAYSWTTWTGNAAAFDDGVNDPLNNYAFDVHSYLDPANTGFDASVVSPTVGVERLTAVTDWARLYGHELFLGEYAAGSDPASVDALKNTLDYMAQNGDVWLGGAYWGAGIPDYPLSIEPVNGADRPQMDLLESYTSGLVHDGILVV